MLRGVHTALATPFRDGALDLDAYAALCQDQLTCGIHGLVANGTTGESATQTDDEWAQVVSTAVRVSAGRVPVTAGCGTNNTATTVALVERAAALGADAALVVLPYYNKPNPAGHRRHLAAVTAVGLPVVAYHVPGRTAQRLSAELLAELTNFDGVVALKEATGDVGFGSDLVAACPDRAVLSGDDFTMFPLIAVGGVGGISVMSNVAPRTTVAMVDAALAGRMDEARRLHHQLMPLAHWLFHTSNPVPVKAALAAKGQCTDEVRSPLAEGDAPPAEILALCT